MSEPRKTEVETTIPVPAYVPEDLVHAWLWCRTNGAQWLVAVALAVIVVTGFQMFQRSRDAKAAHAAEQLLREPNADALARVVAEAGSTSPGMAARLKLAKAYYDDGKYDLALTAYDEFIRDNKAFPFADVAQVGRGYALCGLTRLDESIECFRAFRQKNPGHYLAPQAALGEAACLTMQGKKDAAKVLLQNLRASNRETPWDAAAKRMEGAVDRYQARAAGAMSLMDQANALAPAAAPAAKAP